MVNNDFHIIGTALTDLELISDKTKYKLYILKVEVEKIANSEPFVLPITFISSNRMVDFNGEYQGKMVAVNGYLDVDITKKNPLPRFIGQRIFILEKGVVFNSQEE